LHFDITAVQVFFYGVGTGKGKLKKKSRKKLNQEDEEMQKHEAVSILVDVAYFKLAKNDVY